MKYLSRLFSFLPFVSFKQSKKKDPASAVTDYRTKREINRYSVHAEAMPGSLFQHYRNALYSPNDLVDHLR